MKKQKSNKKSIKEKLIKTFFVEKDNIKEIYYDEQKSNCVIMVLASLIFIIGLVTKTISNMKTIEEIKTMIFLILPILFMNTTFFTLLKIYRNQLEDKFFIKENETLLHSVVYETMLFFISILILLNKDTTGIHQLYIIILMGIYLLFLGSFIKKMFQYELKKNK